MTTAFKHSRDAEPGLPHAREVHVDLLQNLDRSLTHPTQRLVVPNQHSQEQLLAIPYDLDAMSGVNMHTRLSFTLNLCEERVRSRWRQTKASKNLSNPIFEVRN